MLLLEDILYAYAYASNKKLIQKNIEEDEYFSRFYKMVEDAIDEKLQIYAKAANYPEIYIVIYEWKNYEKYIANKFLDDVIHDDEQLYLSKKRDNLCIMSFVAPFQYDDLKKYYSIIASHYEAKGFDVEHRRIINDINVIKISWEKYFK